MNEKVIYLAYHNENIEDGNYKLACKVCKNKTYLIRGDMGEWPELSCACCNARIGAFGWAGQRDKKEER